MNTKGNFGMMGQEMQGVQGPGTGDHQGCGADYACLQCANNGRIDRMAHPEIVGVDNQETSINRIP